MTATSQKRARLSQMAFLAKLVVACDRATSEAMEHRLPGDHILAIREWAEHGIYTLCEPLIPPLDIQPDPVKDACAAAVVAACRNDPEAYAAARRAEAAARAADALAAHEGAAHA